MDDPEERARAFELHVVGEIEFLGRIAIGLTGQRAEAEDLVQDTLLRAYRAIGTFDGRHPRAWLVTILRNTHINRNRRRRPELLTDPDTQLETLASMSSTDRTDAMADGELDTEIVRALEQLDPPFRAVVRLVDIDGLTYAEAAELLGVPIGTVMSRLHRARARIREQLDRPGLAPRSAS